MPHTGSEAPSISAKNAAGLSRDFEYGAILTGQSNSLPWGFPIHAYDYALELAPEETGADLSSVVIPDNAARSVGMVEVITAAPLVTNNWNTSTWLRLGTPTVPQRGYAFVLTNDATTLTVRWLSLPTNNTTVAGYLVRENGKFASYEQARVLTSYLPWQDIIPPLSGGPAFWMAPKNSPYPVPNAPLSAGGRRLTLASPHTLQAAVTAFEDLGLFLPITRREGAEGYGISEIADSSFTGIGTPTGHPLVTISGENFSFANANASNGDFTNAYLLIDWEMGMESKRSWARIESNTSTTFSTVASSWLGDGNPTVEPLASGAATFDPVTNEVIWASHGLVEGDRVFFDGTNPPASASTTVTFDAGTNTVVWASHGMLNGQAVTFTTTVSLPPELVVDTAYFVRNSTGGTFQLSATPTSPIIDLSTAGVGTHTGFISALIPNHVYRVRNVNGTDRFQVSLSMDHAVIDFTTAGGAMTGRQTWVYTVWIPHWKDNPYTWLPGPEFAYPNEDHQPRNSFLHWRARGQVFWGYNGALTPFDGVADSRFGPMLPLANRLASALGKRINMVGIGIGSTPLVATLAINTAAGVYQNTIGWWSYEKTGYALALEDSDSFLSRRLKRLITFMAPQALLAEGNVKPLRYLAACHVQGEADGAAAGGRELYAALITDYKEWLRDLVTANGFSPFAGEAQMPFAQPQITHIPYEVPSTPGVASDLDGYVNNAIREVHTADEFAGWVHAEDLPKINDGHYSGGGMVVLGARLAAEVLDILDHALSYSSPALSSSNSKLIRIANLALLYVGQGARQVQSLSENTAEARTVALFLPEAVSQLLSMRQWSWAMRHEPASPVKHDHPKWLYAYVVPGRALTPINIEPPVAEEGSTTPVFASLLPSDVAPLAVSIPPANPFEIGRSPSGHRLLYTNVAEIPADLSTQIPVGPNENSMHPERLPQSATLYYVDKVVDPGRFSPSFSTALAHLLASMIAPALVKGESGEQVAIRQYRLCAGFLGQEAAHETVTRQKPPPEHRPTWLAER